MKGLRRSFKTCLGFIVLVLMMGCLPRLAPSPGALDVRGWDLLGRREVNFRSDRDTMVVTRARGEFSRIMIVVRDGAVELFDVKLTFGNNETWSPSTRLVFGEGTASRAIDLPGARRVIRRIDFFSKSLKPGLDRAVVEVWGR
jgi:hypothetical protein